MTDAPIDPTEHWQNVIRAVDQLDACKRLALATTLKESSKTDMGQYWRTLMG